MLGAITWPTREVAKKNKITGNNWYKHMKGDSTKTGPQGSNI